MFLNGRLHLFPNMILFFRLMRAYTRRRVRPGMQVVDVASNDFRTAWLFRGCDYFAGDINPAALEKGIRRRPDPLHHPVCCDIRALPFGDDHFDIAVSTHTLVHVRRGPDREKALDELIRVLRPGGDLVFNIPWVRSRDPAFSTGLDARFERIAVHHYRRRLVADWERAVSRRYVLRGSRVVAFLATLVSPLLLVLDRFGRPSQSLYFCEGLKPPPEG